MAVPTWQKRIAAKAPISSQKLGVRSVSRVVQTRCSAAWSAGDSGGAPAGSPSAASPNSRGSLRSTKVAMVQPNTISSAASTAVAAASPRSCTSWVTSGTSTTPPTETPVCEMLMARARRVTNQRVRMALVGTLPVSAKPRASSV